MLYGRLVRLCALQGETHGFVIFIPLAFRPVNTALRHVPRTAGFQDLKNIAVARVSSSQLSGRR